MKSRAVAGAKNEAMVLEAAPMVVEESAMMMDRVSEESVDSAAELDEVGVRSDFSTAIAFEPYLRTDSNYQSSRNRRHHHH